MYFLNNFLILINTFSVFIQNLNSIEVSENDPEPLNAKTERYFIPVSYEWQLTKCYAFEIDYTQSCVEKECEKYLGKPKSIQSIPGDGNCFFNSISYWITGTAKHGKFFRKKIVKSMKTSERFNLLISAEEKLNKHIQKMLDSKEWADSPEIYAAAEFLNTSIYVYSQNGWNFISKDGVGAEELKEPCIYIHHVNNNHFEVITDVHDKDISEEKKKSEKIKNSKKSEESNKPSELQSLVEHNTNIENPQFITKEEENVPSPDSIKHNKKNFQRLFMPTTSEWQNDQCRKMNFIVINYVNKEIVKFLGKPIKIEEIARYGLNGLSSALSYCIAGTTRYRKTIQRNIIEAIKSSSTYKLLSNSENILKNRINDIENNICSSVECPELQVAAEYLKTSIFVYYQSGWEFYSKNGFGCKETAEQCIYLKINTDSNSFDVVTDVENNIE
ncbi:uncharacterized protein LOC126896155 isoform X2 [Daktulosphaira vitifoliae]|uniref:uncharacterized protein LOC126896155 isoform X2 n=1 Tax=Daktulosphaira vitifoliae TaxID=58002 RepID=UPI0021AAE92D|nr:uncharacterized protein LOC126896155 isoform X2 [Daktulosphaira vitifoliae]